MPRHTVHRTKPPHVPFEELSPKGQASRLKKRQQSRKTMPAYHGNGSPFSPGRRSG